jgi:Pentapeptide repeats (8 copies)
VAEPAAEPRWGEIWPEIAEILSGADLRGADLSGADLREAKGIYEGMFLLCG